MNPEIRQLFPVTQRYNYLNHAAVGPISRPVFERMEEYSSELLNHGLVRYREWMAAVQRVREQAATLVNAGPDEIAFAPNTSSGLGMIANGIRWREGDNIVTADCEFPANYLPWQRVGRERGVEVRLARERDGRLETAEILRLIDHRTRVVSLSFVEFGSGFRNDLKTIGCYCRERGVLFVVDAIQGLGALKLDVGDCCVDAFAADAHKFLLGPDGIALLYLRREALEQIEPPLIGWMSVENPFQFANDVKPLVSGARRFEPGTLNTTGVLGLGAAIGLFLKYGSEKIEQYLMELGDYLCEQLRERGYQLVSSRRPGEKSSVICCRHERYSADQLYELLEKERIITTPRLGRLRISPHFYNLREEIDELIQALPG